MTTKVPALWVTAYGPNSRFLTRLAAKAALRSLAFLRALALADRDTFMTL